jgi:protein-S-isoprenylcysteine O-methyltransferase Ste14
MAAVPWQGALAVIVGSVLLITGTLFTLWARSVLGRMWSASPSVKEHHELQTGGPYSVTRHPIYTGMLAMGLGTVLVLGHVLYAIFFVVFLAYLLFKVRSEERLMEDTFGDSYALYRKRVPQLVPGAHRLRGL